jgi:hypothetical protein
MLRAFRLFAAITAVFSLPTSESIAAAARDTKPSLPHNTGYHRAYHIGFKAGYRAGYARGYHQTTNMASPNPPVELFGVRVYGADPCYQYNDRDWDFEKVC